MSPVANERVQTVATTIAKLMVAIVRSWDTPSMAFHVHYVLLVPLLVYLDVVAAEDARHLSECLFAMNGAAGCLSKAVNNVLTRSLGMDTSGYPMTLVHTGTSGTYCGGPCSCVVDDNVKALLNFRRARTVRCRTAAQGDVSLCLRVVLRTFSLADDLRQRLVVLCASLNVDTVPFSKENTATSTTTTDPRSGSEASTARVALPVSVRCAVTGNTPPPTPSAREAAARPPRGEVEGEWDGENVTLGVAKAQGLAAMRQCTATGPSTAATRAKKHPRTTMEKRSAVTVKKERTKTVESTDRGLYVPVDMSRLQKFVASILEECGVTCMYCDKKLKLCKANAKGMCHLCTVVCTSCRKEQPQFDQLTTSSSLNPPGKDGKESMTAPYDINRRVPAAAFVTGVTVTKLRTLLSEMNCQSLSENHIRGVWDDVCEGLKNESEVWFKQVRCVVVGECMEFEEKRLGRVAAAKGGAAQGSGTQQVASQGPSVQQAAAQGRDAQQASEEEQAIWFVEVKLNDKTKARLMKEGHFPQGQLNAPHRVYIVPVSIDGAGSKRSYGNRHTGCEHLACIVAGVQGSAFRKVIEVLYDGTTCRKCQEAQRRGDTVPHKGNCSKTSSHTPGKAERKALQRAGARMVGPARALDEDDEAIVPIHISADGDAKGAEALFDSAITAMKESYVFSYQGIDEVDPRRNPDLGHHFKVLSGKLRNAMPTNAKYSGLLGKLITSNCSRAVGELRRAVQELTSTTEVPMHLIMVSFEAKSLMLDCKNRCMRVLEHVRGHHGNCDHRVCDVAARVVARVEAYKDNAAARRFEAWEAMEAVLNGGDGPEEVDTSTTNTYVEPTPTEIEKMWEESTAEYVQEKQANNITAHIEVPDRVADKLTKIVMFHLSPSVMLAMATGLSTTWNEGLWGRLTRFSEGKRINYSGTDRWYCFALLCSALMNNRDKERQTVHQAVDRLVGVRTRSAAARARAIHDKRVVDNRERQARASNKRKRQDKDELAVARAEAERRNPNVYKGSKARESANKIALTRGDGNDDNTDDGTDDDDDDDDAEKMPFNLNLPYKQAPRKERKQKCDSCGQLHRLEDGMCYAWLRWEETTRNRVARLERHNGPMRPSHLRELSIIAEAGTD